MWAFDQAEQAFKALPLDQQAREIALAMEKVLANYPKHPDKPGMAEGLVISTLKAKVKSFEQYCRDKQSAA